MVLPTVVGILYAWRAGMPLGLLGDVFAAPGALAIAIGRIGCVMAGCCYGKVCATGLPSAWGMHFPRGSVAFSELSRLGQVDAHAIGTPALVPVQVFEIVGCLLLMAGVTFVARLVRGGRGVSGEAFLGFGATYAVLRFGLEFLRADNPPAWGGLTFSQGVMVGVFLLALGTCGIRRVWGGRWGLSALKTVAPSASSEQGVAGNSEQRGEGEGAARGVAGAHP
jgi:phosphatidylglycerol:prolipoprotein diacylglycerol transferase